MFSLFGKLFMPSRSLSCPIKSYLQSISSSVCYSSLSSISSPGKQSKWECFYFRLRNRMSGCTSTWVMRTHAVVDCSLRSKCIYEVGKIFCLDLNNRHRRSQTVKREPTQLSVADNSCLYNFNIFKHTQMQVSFTSLTCMCLQQHFFLHLVCPQN